MSDTTSTDPIARLKAVVALGGLATPGTWDCWDMDEFNWHVFADRFGTRAVGQDCRKSIAAVRWGRSHPEGEHVPMRRDPGRAANYFEMQANAEFIAAAKNSVPDIQAMLARVEKLEVVGRKILAKLDSETASVTQWDADELRAALEAKP